MLKNTKIKFYDTHLNYSCFSNKFFLPDEDKNLYERKKRTNFEKSQNITRPDSIKRALDSIYDIAYCNHFDYFVTFTFNDTIVNANDYDLCIKKLKKWLNNMVSRNGLLYLLVPELHKSGRIHFHALMSGELRLIDSGHKDKTGKVIYNVGAWKYGFTTAVQITGEYEKVCNYITKYVSKELTKITPNFYYAGGHGLERKPPVMYCDTDYASFFGNEYYIPSIDSYVKYRVERL